jgi:CelD/BcsL family acetyltransferase involved in cellulose biosynthesis
MLSTKIVTGAPANTELAPDWERILRSCSQGIRGPDETCSPVWAQALSQTWLKGAELRTLVVRSGDETVGVIPTYVETASNAPLNRRELRVITEAYAGRRGLLVRNDDPQIVEFALASLRRSLAPWDVFLFNVVEGSPSHAAIEAAARSLRMRCIDTNEAPYIELGKSWDDMLAALPKKMRWTIRKSEKDLSAKGKLEYEEVTTPSAVPAFLESMYAIERKSWKEESGTSITTQQKQQEFFEAFAPLAAQAGRLSAHLLKLDGQPLAYIFGVTAGDGVFLDFKESFDASWSEFSPGHVLKRYAFERIIARGVSLYDFMGKCEPYKMRWTDRTYRTLTVALFNGSIAGSLSYLRSRMGGHSRPLPAFVPPGAVAPAVTA